ncbi:hypothetical protein AB0B78_40445 [Streptomyces sp. NPDC040724]|uniref:hypothetical protein n=1 Tax=Streptomyces sp. NPDC040724 TaxID=3155612 RepID=UPI0033E48D93
MRRVSGSDERNGRRTRGLVQRVLVGLLVAGVSVACGPAEGDGPAVSLPPVASSASAVPSQTSALPSETPSPSSSPTPSASPSALPSPSVPVATRSADPKPAATQTTKAPSRQATAECEIVSNAGNCYNAGQFCRKADLGRSTHAGNGRMIHCRLDGSQPRWQY